MLFEDNSVTIVPHVERTEGRALAAKVISTTLSRARQICVEMSASSLTAPDSSATKIESLLVPGQKVGGSGSLKGGSLAHLMQRDQQRPSFANLDVLGRQVPKADIEKVFQDLLWEENRIQTYAIMLANPDSKNVVLFDSKRNEL